MQPIHRFYLLIGGVVVVVIAIVAIASGGDDDDTTAPETLTGAAGVALTQAEYTDEVDGICAEAYAALAAFDASDGETQTVAGQKQEVVSGIVDSIESLGTPPPEDQAALNDFLDALQDASRQLRQQERAAEQGDIAGADAFGAQANASLADARAAAGDYGFDDCSKQPKAPGTGTGGGGGGTADTGGTAPAPAPTEPAPTTPAPTTPPTGGTGGGGTDTGDTDTGDTGGGTGGVSP